MHVSIMFFFSARSFDICKHCFADLSSGFLGVMCRLFLSLFQAFS